MALHHRYYDQDNFFEISGVTYAHQSTLKQALEEMANALQNLFLDPSKVEQ